MAQILYIINDLEGLTVALKYKLTNTHKSQVMKYVIPPLSDSMVEKLKQCRQIELQGNSDRPIRMDDLNYAMAPLYKRGFVDTTKKKIGGREFLCIFVTEAGIDFLEKINAEEQTKLRKER